MVSNEFVDSKELVSHVLTIMEDKEKLVRPLAMLRALTQR